MRTREDRARKRTIAVLSALLLTSGLFAPGSVAAAAPDPGADEFSLVGVSWPAARGGLGGTAQVRTRDAGTGVWSPWRSLEAGQRQTESGVRSATEPLWTGPADRAQTRLLRADGSTAALPRGARLERVDPGEGPELAAAGTVETRRAGVIITRRQWGANESWRDDPPEYGSKVKAVLVHHTVNSNGYSCSQAPSIIRAIYRYHVRTNGWNDIGYNFLVDKCGRIYEGRYGGGSKPVIGAHSLGFNTNTSGIAVIGDYRSKTVPTGVTTILARFARWKLGLAGYTSTSKVRLTAGVDNGKYDKGDKVTVYRVAGHRNVFATSCPGAKLYAKLPAIRSRAR